MSLFVVLWSFLLFAGGEATFETKYVNITETLSQDESIGGQNVDTTVFQLNVTFTMTNSFARWVDEVWDEEEDVEELADGVIDLGRKLADEDKRARYANKCLSGSVNRKKNKTKRCEKKPEKNKNIKFAALGSMDETPILEDYGAFYNRSFTEVVRETTDLEPESTIHSVLDATSSIEILLCGLAHLTLLVFYDEAAEEYEEFFQPYLQFFCRKYEEYSCSKYENYLCDDYEKANCRDPCVDIEQSPTMSPWPTVSPTTAAPTSHFTSRPTWEPPVTKPDVFFWGASEAFGGEGDDESTHPIKMDKTITDTAAGPGYSMILVDDGTVQAAGYIDSLPNYRGHLGLPLEDLTEGANSFQNISKVDDTTTGSVIEAPRFHKIYAGADQLSVGAMHSLLIDDEGVVWTMGSNSKGQLCLGDFEDRMIPTKVPMSGRIVSAAIGGQHTLLLHEQGFLFGCGSNENGQIGQGNSTINSSDPSTIYLPEPAETISSGLSHSLILTKKKIFVMGENDYGQLCASSHGKSVFYPSELTLFSNFARRDITSFSSIQSSSYLLFLDGSIVACGRNDFGQLGDGTYTDKISTGTLFLAPIRRLGVGPSSQSAFFIGYNNNAYATGLNDRGQLGSGDTENRDYMSKVTFKDNIYVERISAASDHAVSGSISLTTLKKLFYWGNPDSFGNSGASVDTSIPMQTGNIAADVSAGSSYSLILLQDGIAQSAGFVDSIEQYHGHLGLPIDDVIEGPNQLQTISQVYDTTNDIITTAPTFTRVYAGSDDLSPGAMHSLFIDEFGQVWTTGSNAKGQLCLGDNVDRMIPTKVPVTGRITKAAIGGQHTLLLDENGFVFVCGSNERGQIGLGENITEVNTLTLLDLVFVESISAGLDFSLIMSPYNGFVVTGSNSYGQLCANSGGETVFSLAQLSIENGLLKTWDVKSFEASKSSSYLLLNNGATIACGRNNAGQLGDGTNVDKISVYITLPAFIRGIGVGPSSESAFFIGNDGNTYAVGLNDNGQLGLGDTINRNNLTLVDFDEATSVEQISPSGNHVLCRGGVKDNTEVSPLDLELDIEPLELPFGVSKFPSSEIRSELAELTFDIPPMNNVQSSPNQSYAEKTVQFGTHLLIDEEGRL